VERGRGKRKRFDLISAARTMCSVFPRRDICPAHHHRNSVQSVCQIAKQLAELQRFPGIQTFGQSLMELRCLFGKLAKKNQATIGNEDENPPAVFIIYDSLYQTVFVGTNTS